MATIIDTNTLEQQKPVPVEVSPLIPDSSEQLAQIATQSAQNIQGDLDKLSTVPIEESIASLVRSTGQRANEQQKLQSELGVDRLRTQLSDISRRAMNEPILQGAARLQAESDLQGTAATTGTLNRSFGNIDRAAAARSLVYSAQANLLQGQVETANNLIETALDAKFKPIENEIQIQKFNLERLDKQIESGERKLTAAQTKQFEAQKSLVNRKETEERENKKTIQDITKQLLENGAGASIVNSVLNQDTVEGALDQAAKSGYMRDPLDAAYKSAQIKKMKVELAAMSSNNVPSEIKKLDNTQRVDLQNARTTTQQLERLKEIVSSNSDMKTFLKKGSPEAREFSRLSKDVVDKMARERTGAVVGKDEQAAFEKIMGLGFFNAVTSSDEEINKTLDGFISQHDQTQQLIDPSGEIRGFLDARLQEEGVSIPTSSSRVSVGANSIIDEFIPVELDPIDNIIGGVLGNVIN